MSVRELASLARTHWTKWLPQTVADLRASGQLNEALQGAAGLAQKEIELLMKQGYQEHEAREAALPMFILLPPEPGAEEEDWERLELAEKEAEYPAQPAPPPWPRIENGIAKSFLARNQSTPSASKSRVSLSSRSACWGAGLELGMAESKSTHFACLINAYSEIRSRFDGLPINGLARHSECRRLGDLCASAHMASSLARTRAWYNSWRAWGYPYACNSHSIAW